MGARSKGHQGDNGDQGDHTNNFQLDLGLSDLMSGGPSSAPSTPSSASASEAPVGSIATTPEVSQSAYQQLVSESRWSDLVRLSEDNLSLGDCSEARVWWVRGHLGALSMPASFLAAPLEALCRKLAGTDLSAALRHALGETGPLLLKRLEDVADRDQAVSLRAALERLGVIQPIAPLTEKQRRKTQTNLHSISSQPFSLKESPKAVALSRDEKRKNSAPRSGLSAQRLFALAAMLLLAVAVGLWAFMGRSDSLWGSNTVLASESFVPAGEGAEQLIPATDSRDLVGSLSALFYSMRGHEQTSGGDSSSGASGTQPAAGVAPSQQQSSPDVAAPEARVTDSARASASRTKDRVNTTGPLEGAEFQRDKTTNSDHDRDSRRDPLRPQLPAVNDSPSMRHDKPAVDVSRMGRVSHSTSVYAAPNYKAEILGRLEPGDKVMIEGNAGRWLRLRSRKGNGGYVLRDDVAEAYER
jgi:hypothetical protein